MARPAERAAAAAGPSDFWFFASLSGDGKRALLQQERAGGAAVMRLRAVEVDTGATLDEVDLKAVAALPRETLTDGGGVRGGSIDAALRAPALEGDLRRAAALLARFPLGAAPRVAAAPDGAAVAFNAGDWIYLADAAGRVGKRVASQASYDPWFAPDGRHLLFRRMNGRADRFSAKYDLFVAPSDLATAPRPVAGTAELHGHALSADGRSVVALSSHEPQLKSCFVSIALAPPFGSKRLGCLEGGEQLVRSLLSPTGRWAAVSTARATDEDDPDTTIVAPGGKERREKRFEFRLRVVRTESGEVVRDEAGPSGFLIALSDEGLLVGRRAGERAFVLDATTGRRRELAAAAPLGVEGRFRGPRELVSVDGGRVSVVDVGPPP
jgi:hypothetical protein